LILPIIILLLLFIAVPGEYSTRICSTTEEHSTNIWNTECGRHLVDGCFSSCTGITIKTINEVCSELSYDLKECNSTCIGIVTGTCDVNPINAKISFLKSLLNPK